MNMGSYATPETTATWELYPSLVYLSSEARLLESFSRSIRKRTQKNQNSE